jgi:peptidoglycan pentaglycine glycine transferase (the first glycine)
VAIHEATTDELRDWDHWTVEPVGGTVHQSLPWAAYRGSLGWRARHLVFDDGFRLLSLERPWPLVGGSGAYLSRGPIGGDEPVERTADRLREAADWLAERGVDVVASDAEIEASTGYGRLVEERGFARIDEVQPSRDRMRLRLGGVDETAAFAGFNASLRQRIRGAEKARLRVVCHDGRAGGHEVGSGAAGSLDGEAAADPARLFGRFYDDLLGATAERRHFHVGPRSGFVDWSVAALAAGQLVYLEVHAPDGTVLGGATFYRHGRRLTYSHSGDRVEDRRTYPGVIHLLLWRAIEVAIVEGLDEMDLGGVDVPGARRIPRPDEPMYGLYAFKRSFGAEWVELAGNHEWVARPMRYLAGRAAGRVLGLGGRGR